jgi:hypothetical protein
VPKTSVAATPVASAPVANRRNHPRYTVSRSFRLSRVNAMFEEVFTAQVLEAAPLGLRLLTEEAVIPGELVRLESTDPRGPALVVTAEVQWVTVDVDGWRVGCELRRELTRDELRAMRAAAK